MTIDEGAMKVKSIYNDWDFFKTVNISEHVTKESFKIEHIGHDPYLRVYSYATPIVDFYPDEHKACIRYGYKTGTVTTKRIISAICDAFNIDKSLWIFGKEVMV